MMLGPGADRLREGFGLVVDDTAAESLDLLARLSPTQANRDRPVGHGVGQSADASERLRGEDGERRKHLRRADAPRYVGARTIACVEQGSQTLVVLGVLAEDRVGLVEQQGRAIGVDLAKDDGF
jgi:hypothetical protein